MPDEDPINILTPILIALHVVVFFYFPTGKLLPQGFRKLGQYFELELCNPVRIQLCLNFSQIENVLIEMYYPVAVSAHHCYVLIKRCIY